MTRELSDRVGTLMVDIIDDVTSGHDDIKTITEAAEKIQEDVEDLIRQVLCSIWLRLITLLVIALWNLFQTI